MPPPAVKDDTKARVLQQLEDLKEENRKLREKVETLIAKLEEKEKGDEHDDEEEEDDDLYD